MDFEVIAQHVGEALKAENLKLVTAESCTGGWLAQVITAIPGSSAWFDCGFVTYSNSSKHKLLGVQSQTLTAQGAVSEQTALEMAAGALRGSEAQVSIAITGIAGPGGGTPEKPVGTVWLAWSIADDLNLAEHRLFVGDRQTIRAQAVAYALTRLLDILNRDPT